MSDAIEREASSAAARAVIEQHLAALRPRLRSFLGGRPFPALARFSQTAIDQALETLVADGVLVRSRRIYCPICDYCLDDVTEAPVSDAVLNCPRCDRTWTRGDLDWATAQMVYTVQAAVRG
jgi:hypothetical protein